MSLQRKDVVLAGIGAFVAWGLLVKWLPVLRFLGYAFVLGVTITLAFITWAITCTSRPRPAYTAPPIPSFLNSSEWQSETSRYLSLQQYKPAELYPSSFLVSQALETLLNLALRDFVSSWYGNITKSPAFVNQVDKNIRIALRELRDRILREDLVNLVVSRLVPIFTAHLREFDQAERAIRGRALSRNVTESEELDLAVAAKYKDGRVHPAASLTYSDTKSVQQDHLRKIMIRILPDLLPESMTRSRAVSVLIKEIVSCAVLLPVVQLLSDPDTWNQIIQAYGRTALHDRKTVKRMRAALDEHASPSTKRVEAELPLLAPHDSERAFERFVRVIRKTKNLSDARRYRSQIASQLKREAMESQDPTYIRRLEMGKRVLDQKIARLAAIGSTIPAAVMQSDFHNGDAKPKDMSLVEIMHTSSGLSYFMEFMDRQHRMSLVQFWVVVDGFRNPLEDAFGEEGPGASTTWTDADRTDIAQISETYMSKPELVVPQEHQDAIRTFLVVGRKATPEQYRAARRAVLAVQSTTLEEMELRYLPAFKKSDLYYKFLASDDIASKKTSNVTSPLRPQSPARKTQSFMPPLHRTGSQAPAKSKDLRRAAMSSTDVRSLGSSRLFDDEPMRSSFDNDSSSPLFDDGYDTDPLASSTYSIGHDSNGDHAEQTHVMENMEAALNDIITESPQDDWDDNKESLLGSPAPRHKSRKPESPRISLDTRVEIGQKSKPSLATLGLVNTSSRIGVFTDNDLFGDEEKFLEDEYVEEDRTAEFTDEEIHEAAPGDLGLTEAITMLTHDVEKLVSQESIVNALTRKAELTNNVTELRILGKSRSSLQREIRRKELQRQQYIVQESDNSLYGRSNIQVKSVMVGKEDDGREFALYVVEVQRQAGDQMPSATWAIARRYSEFHDLHQRLRRRYPSTRSLEFPRRRVVMKLQKQFLHNRRVALENYLQQLLRMPDVCRSRELRSFLSQQAILSHSETSSASDTQDIVTRIYNSVTDGMDEFLGNIAVIDQLTAAGQNLITAATSQLGAAQNDVVSIEPGSIAEAEAELRAFEDKELEPFVKPICDIFLEIFELNRGNNWLRGRAVVVVLHQLLGGTVERKLRDVVKGLTQEDSVIRYIDMVKDTMWPGGKMRESTPRTAAEKTKTKKEAGVMLATLIPDLAASVVGRANAQAAARRIAATMNNARLNQHLVFTVLDEVITVLFDAPRRNGVVHGV